MAVATFDTLKFADTLKAGGTPPAQAEAHARAMAEVIQLNLKELVTKDDLDRAVEQLRRDFREESLKQAERIGKLETKTDWQFTLLRWMVGALIALCTGIGYRLFFGRPPG